MGEGLSGNILFKLCSKHVVSNSLGFCVSSKRMRILILQFPGPVHDFFFFFPGFWSQLEPRFFYRKKKEKKTKKYQSLDFVCSAFLKFGCREVHTKDNKLSDDLMSELWDQEF